jgi:L,D-peptidoglycan transpeptidase YkuD (ErfK/YbiS/YcfS/YnhG family)
MQSQPADRRTSRIVTVLVCAVLAVAVLPVAVLPVTVLARSSGRVAGASADTREAVHPYEPTAADQVVVVNASSWGSSSAQLTAYRWANGAWQAEIGPITAGIGANGFTDTPHEADGFTPIGEYRFTTVFGSRPDPGTLFPYRVATSDDHWVDDPTSAVYNTWQVGASAGRWQSAETLSSYSYAASFDFNQGPVIADGNSAIFLHGGGGATPGCVEIGTTNLLAVLRWLDPAAHPVIVLGVSVGPPAHLGTGDVAPAHASVPAVRGDRVTNTG